MFEPRSTFLQAADSTLPSPLTQLVAQSLKNCEGDIRTPLVGSVVVTGGGSLLPGVLDRLSNELIRTVGTVRSFLSLSRATYIHFRKPRSSRRATWLNVGMVHGSVALFWQAWDHSISFGSAHRSGRSVFDIKVTCSY